jgi:hypothetical protein
MTAEPGTESSRTRSARAWQFRVRPDAAAYREPASLCRPLGAAGLPPRGLGSIGDPGEDDAVDPSLRSEKSSFPKSDVIPDFLQPKIAKCRCTIPLWLACCPR